MLPELSKIKGIHPGAVLKRELKHLGWKNNRLAESLGEHPQTISSILKEKRGVNPKLSIKLGNLLGAEADYFMLLQASHDVKLTQRKNQLKTPDLAQIRKILFWDTEFESIDWQRDKVAVIKRVFERGNDTEIKAIIAFYGRQAIDEIVEEITNQYLPTYTENLQRFGFLV